MQIETIFFHISKHVNEALRFQKRSNRKQDSRKGKRFGKSSKENDRIF